MKLAGPWETIQNVGIFAAKNVLALRLEKIHSSSFAALGQN